ncbi:MAG: tetratricopeptide repeat protein [Bradymonadia bacterium]
MATSGPQQGPIWRSSLWVLLAVCLLPAASHGQGLTRPVDIFEAPLRDYRRLELVVPADFQSTCTPNLPPDALRPLGPNPVCAITGAPRGLYRLLGPLHDGLLAEVSMGKADGKDTVTFTLTAEDLIFRSAVFDLPRRWVIEIGRPTTMSATIEDELPFRPYPMKMGEFNPPLPVSQISGLDEEEDTLGEAFNACLDEWRQGRVVKAMRMCEALIARWPVKRAPVEAVHRAWRVVAEARYRLSLRGRGKEEALLKALLQAEASHDDPQASFRYVAMAIRFMANRTPGKATKWLREREKKYMKTAAEPDFRASRAGLFIQNDEFDKALPVLEEAGRASFDDPHRRRFVGYAKLSLAALAYESRRYGKSLMIYERLSKDWPGLLMEDAASIFRFAELLNQVGRHDQARRLYEAFLEHTPEAHPFFMVRVRLAQMIGLTDIEASEEALNALKTTLPGTQAQNLALLHQSRLTNRPEWRKRILRRVSRTAQTDYIRGAVLVEQARQAIKEGDLRQHYEVLKTLRKQIPEEPTLLSAPYMWPRAVYLLLTNYIYHDRPLAALSLFYSERKVIEGHPQRAELHLRVGQALRGLGALEEALVVLQGGLSPDSEIAEKDAVARIYLEMAGVLRDSGDQFRTARALDYLDRSYPNRFDNFEYWMSQGTRARWEGRLEEARDIFRYAINGPVSVKERTDLTEALAEVYEEMEAWALAVRAWDAVAAFHDEGQGKKADPRRRGARWRVAEIEFEQGEWLSAVAALDRFVQEYPTDYAVQEARFLMAKSLMKIGSTRSAVEVLDGLSRQRPQGPYNRMAQQELDLLAWSKGSRGDILKAAGLD